MAQSRQSSQGDDRGVGHMRVVAESDGFQRRNSRNRFCRRVGDLETLQIDFAQERQSGQIPDTRVRDPCAAFARASQGRTVDFKMLQRFPMRDLLYRLVGHSAVVGSELAQPWQPAEPADQVIRDLNAAETDASYLPKGGRIGAVEGG